MTIGGAFGLRTISNETNSDDGTRNFFRRFTSYLWMLRHVEYIDIIL